MDRHHDLLQLDDFYSYSTLMVQNSFFMLEKQICELRTFVSDEKRKVLELLRNNVNQNTTKLEAKRNFFDYALKELVKVEEIYKVYCTHLKADVAEESGERMTPPTYTSLAKVKRALKCCKPIIPQENDPRAYFFRAREWINVSISELDFTGDVLARPKILMPSDFDDSDLRFKQEMSLLRMKMFAMQPHSDENFDTIKDEHNLSTVADSKTEFIETLKKSDSFSLPTVEALAAQIGVLKFVDGEYKIIDGWARLLDVRGKQLRSKWHLVVKPQVEKILKRRKAPVAHLHPIATFNFLETIPENGINFVMTIERLLPLLDNPDDVRPWVSKWGVHFGTIQGQDIAATLIQSCWRGFRIRKKINESLCKYIAASIIWHAWTVVKRKRQMNQQHLRRVETSFTVARNLSLKLSREFDNLTKHRHVVIDLTSLGFIRDIRRTIPSRYFPYLQNTMHLKFSYLRNPNAEVIYVLPMKLKQNCMDMYNDIIDSVAPNRADVKSRITFLGLAHIKIFQTRSFNVSRSLYFSDQSFKPIKDKIKGKSSFFLPWIMDECDVILSHRYGIPILGPDLEYQRKLLNVSYCLEMIGSLGLKQPAYQTNINDYKSLCLKLAELICFNTEICCWMFKVNVGTSKHMGIFLINHISIPFMPILRRERSNYSEEEWRSKPELHDDYLVRLKQHLLEVVSKVTKLPYVYKCWKEFEVSMTKYGIAIQEMLQKDSANQVTVTLFFPGKASGKKPKWTGTADKIFLESNVTSCLAYMTPQTLIELAEIEPAVTKLSESLHENGYFGYISLDFCFHRQRQQEQMKLSVIQIHPYYSHAQHFIDWVKFAINGSYNRIENAMEADIKLVPESGRRKASMDIHPIDAPSWNETTERYAIGIARLHHSVLSFYQWPKLKTLAEDCGIKFDAKMKEGSHLIPNNNEIKEYLMYTAIGTDMKSTLGTVERHLKILQKVLSAKARKKNMTVETNIRSTANYFTRLYLDYENVFLQKCVTQYNPL